jgi:hypothetical protein
VLGAIANECAEGEFVKTRPGKVVAAFVILLLVTTGRASAAILEGHRIAVEADAFDFRGQHIFYGGGDAIVGPGVELPEIRSWAPLLGIDFSDANILITANVDRPLLGGLPWVLHFTDANLTIPRFVAATLNPATNWDEFGPEAVFVAPNEIRLAMSPGRGLAGQHISLDIAVLVPEPGAAVFAGVGVLAAAGWSRRRGAKFVVKR